MTEANTGYRIGYARCSTDKQDLRAQRAELAKLNPDQVYVDEGRTGTKRDNRAGLDQALAAVREGDTLVVTKLDRLARSVPDARAIADDLHTRGVRLQLGSTVYDPHDPMGRMFFNMLATFAEFEADIARARTREGMAAAKASGKLAGGKPKLSKAQQREVRRMADSGDYTRAEIGELFGVSRPTVYRVLERTRPVGEEADGEIPGQQSIEPAPEQDGPLPDPSEEGAESEQPPQEPAPRRAPRPRAPSRGKAVCGGRRSYTTTELNDYRLEPVTSDTGETLRYRVLIAGDDLGAVERAPYGHTGWQAHTATGGRVLHTGRGRYAKNRQSAVVDLLAELGVTTRD